MNPTVVDLPQLVRIQGTHRGFLYQHLYAVACLLSAPSTGTRSVCVERDEDVELRRDGEVIYAQIKTRSSPLSPSDLDGVLDRFESIRSAHEQGERSGSARFAIVASNELGPTLARWTWPDDVLVVTPSTQEASLGGTGLVVPPTSVSDLFSQAHILAEAYRLSALRPESLVSKLVGAVVKAAAGEGAITSFATADLERTCELVAAQLRPLPAVANYRAQSNEPALPSDNRGLTLVGHAGDGKSAWAAELAAHSSETAVYLPCSSSPGEQIAARLVDATIATLVGRGDVRAHELLLPGREGADALSLVDRVNSDRGYNVMAIIDDCHLATAATLIGVMRAAPSFRWVLLGHPSRVLSEVATLMELETVSLGGWNDDVVACLLAEEGCSTSPSAVAELRQVTGGAPLFVLHAVAAMKRSNYDTKSYARALLQGTTPNRSAQEILLEGTAESLAGELGQVASSLATIDVAFVTEEWVRVITGSLAIGSDAIRRALRTLADLRVTVVTLGDVVSLHDAFRPLLRERFLGVADVKSLREGAAGHLRSQLLEERAAERIVAYMRILTSLGKLSEVADVANALTELIRETGIISEVRGLLEACLEGDSLGNEDRFWALDTLAFFDIEEKRHESAAEHLAAMEVLSGELDDHARGALIHKRVLVAMSRNETEKVRNLVADGATDDRYGRILRYCGALAEGFAGNVEVATAQLTMLADEYLGKLGLTKKQVIARNPVELHSMMAPDADVSDVRHLADCFDALVKFVKDARGSREPWPLFAIWASKFYVLAGANRSALRAGQDARGNLNRGYWVSCGVAGIG